MSRLGATLRRRGPQLAVVLLGLALGLGAMSFSRFQTSRDRPSRTPSAKQFAFATPASLPPVSAPVAAAGSNLGPEPEPADPEDALTAFLDAEASGSPGAAWALLDSAGRQRWPTSSLWSATQGERSRPVAFEVQASTPGADPADVRLSVQVDRTPSLDRFRGLVPARSAEVWRVRNEDGRWRVSPTPIESKPEFPAEAAAPDAVRGWMDAMVACDQPAALRFQVEPDLLGPADIAAIPCRQKGTWTIGTPVTVDRGGDVQPLLAAYGQSAAAWARLVPVEGAGRRFWAEVAPVGEGWMVVGVAAG